MHRRQLVSTGTVWEERVGYSRAVRVDDFVYVSGTTSTGDDGTVIGIDNPAAQTRFILQKIERALIQAGASLADVVRYRVYVVNANDWELIAPVLHEFFGDVRPANTLVEISRLVGSDYLIEIEADAIAGSALYNGSASSAR